MCSGGGPELPANRNGAVVVRQWPRRERRVPPADIDRFDIVTAGEGYLDGKRGGPQRYLALPLNDGSDISVRVPGDALQLNNGLLRQR